MSVANTLKNLPDHIEAIFTVNTEWRFCGCFLFLYLLLQMVDGQFLRCNVFLGKLNEMLMVAKKQNLGMF